MFTICRTGPYLSTVQQQLQHGQHCLQRRRAAAHQAAGGAGRIVHTGAEAKPRFGRVFNGSMMNDYIYIYFVHIYIYKQYIISSIYIAHIYIYSFPTSLCAVLVFDSVSCLLLDRLRLRLRPPSLSPTTLSHTHNISHTTLSPTIFHTQLCQPPSFTHNFVTHHLSHTILSPTIFHTPLCHTPSFTHHLSHSTLSPTILHTPLCHTPSFTHHFVTHHLSHTHTALSPTIFRTPSFTHHLSHTHTHNFVTIILSPAIFHTQLCHTLDKSGSFKRSDGNWIPFRFSA